MDKYCVIFLVIDPDSMPKKDVVREIMGDVAKKGRYLLTESISPDKNRILIKDEKML